jgi:hypothetical protein
MQNTSLLEDPVDPHEIDPNYNGSDTNIGCDDDEVDAEDIEANDVDDHIDDDHDNDHDNELVVVVASDIDHIDSIMDHC